MLDDQALHDLMDYEEGLDDKTVFNDVLECIGCSKEYKQKKEMLEEAVE